MNMEKVSAPKFKPTHPGEMFKRRLLDEYKISLTEAAKRLGVSRKHLTNFANGHVSCSVELAQRIAAATGSGVGLWINLQANYDIWQAENQAAPKVEMLA